MKIKALLIAVINLWAWGMWAGPANALEHVQKDGLFSMNVPEGWQWFEAAQETVITYPDGKTVAIDIQWLPSRKLTQAEIKDTIKRGDDKMIKEGIQAHNGTLIGNKEIRLNGVYATQLDFNTSPPGPIHVTYISFYNKGNAMTITYGSTDEKIHSVMDDVVATIRF